MDYLYHYTNIETLALILSNRTIRFNSLDKMDDLQENETADLKNLGKAVFISSWTDSETESIPMWNMYSSLSSGVRIRLKKYPFHEEELSAENLKAIGNFTVRAEETKGECVKTVVPVTEMFKRGIVFPGLLKQEQILHKVEYTSDYNKLYPKVFSEDKDGYTIALEKLGIYKNMHWDFQNEWRYILRIFPIDLLDIDNANKNVMKMFSDMVSGNFQNRVSYFDLELEDDAFEDMEIVMSPRISPGNKVIVSDLVEKYNPKAKVTDSVLLGLL